LQTEDLLQIL